MHLRCITNIIITQIPRTEYPNRKEILTFNFVHSFECKDTWEDLTNNGKVIVPKNIYVQDVNGQLVSLSAPNVNVGGFSTSVANFLDGGPLLMRGDKITINAGYRYFDVAGIDTVYNSQIFQGFISKVTSKKPIEFEVEDNMWILKQTPVNNHTFSASDTLESILTFITQGTGFTVNALTATTFGAFQVGNETAAEVLARLKRLYHFESYFRGNELRSGTEVYIPTEAITQKFQFQNNIISDELEYRRKDDIVLSAVARNTIVVETGETTKDGQPKTKKKRLEVLVSFLTNGTVTNFVKKTGQDYPPNTGGERREFFFPGATTIQQLEDLAAAQLKKYYYTGFKGSFTTFGMPFVRQGDNAEISDPILPERNGTYKIKKVEYSGGVEGLRQKITLDFLIQI